VALVVQDIILLAAVAVAVATSVVVGVHQQRIMDLDIHQAVEVDPLMLVALSMDQPLLAMLQCLQQEQARKSANPVTAMLVFI
jgi:hypothetical protein